MKKIYESAFDDISISDIDNTLAVSDVTGEYYPYADPDGKYIYGITIRINNPVMNYNCSEDRNTAFESVMSALDEIEDNLLETLNGSPIIKNYDKPIFTYTRFVEKQCTPYRIIDGHRIFDVDNMGEYETAMLFMSSEWNVYIRFNLSDKSCVEKHRYYTVKSFIRLLVSGFSECFRGNSYGTVKLSRSDDSIVRLMTPVTFSTDSNDSYVYSLFEVLFQEIGRNANDVQTLTMYYPTQLKSVISSFNLSDHEYTAKYDIERHKMIVKFRDNIVIVGRYYPEYDIHIPVYDNPSKVMSTFMFDFTGATINVRTQYSPLFHYWISKLNSFFMNNVTGKIKSINFVFDVNDLSKDERYRFRDLKKHSDWSSVSKDTIDLSNINCDDVTVCSDDIMDFIKVKQ